MRNRFVIRTLIVMLVLVLGVPLYAVSYTPTTYVPTSYTSSYTSTTDPSMAAIRKLATTTNDEGDELDESEIPGRWSDLSDNDIMDESEFPDSWSEPSPLGDGWILLLFALAYAAYILLTNLCKSAKVQRNCRVALLHKIKS